MVRNVTVRSVAHHRHERSRAASRGVGNRRMEYLRTLFEPLFRGDDEVEVRCLVFYSLWIGSQFIAVDQNGRSRANAPIPYTWLLHSPRRERLAAQRHTLALGTSHSRLGGR